MPARHLPVLAVMLYNKVMMFNNAASVAQAS
jgi:hypothetical protein